MIYSVKEISKLMGMTEHAIRFYTDEGLLPCKRDKNNRRVFDEESINWLTGIQCLKGCGMSIEDIRDYSNLCMQGDTDYSIKARYEIMLKQRDIAKQRLREAEQLVEYMEQKVKHYEEVVNHKIPDDTNPATWISPPIHDPY